MPFLSIVVPCYNEEEVLDELHRQLTNVCQENVGDNYEIVLVDDGSRDATRTLIEAMTKQDDRIVGVFLSRNHGHQLALSAGLSVCRGERILIIDADLQDPPELLGPMLAKMDEGYDVVYGQRRSRRGETAFKKATAAAFYRLFKRLVDIDIPLDTGDFRLMSRRALNVLLEMPERHRFIRGMVSWIGFKQAPLPYERNERFAGETKYPLKKMLLFALDAITSFSTVPLRLATWLGVIVALLSIPIALYIVIQWATGHTIPGWPSIGLLVLFLGSAQLIVVGILGEYVGRLYMQTKGRPLFVIEEVVRSEFVADTPSKTKKKKSVLDKQNHIAE